MGSLKDRIASCENVLLLLTKKASESEAFCDEVSRTERALFEIHDSISKKAFAFLETLSGVEKYLTDFAKSCEEIKLDIEVLANEASRIESEIEALNNKVKTTVSRLNKLKSSVENWIKEADSNASEAASRESAARSEHERYITALINLQNQKNAEEARLSQLRSELSNLGTRLNSADSKEEADRILEEISRVENQIKASIARLEGIMQEIRINARFCMQAYNKMKHYANEEIRLREQASLARSCYSMVKAGLVATEEAFALIGKSKGHLGCAVENLRIVANNAENLYEEILSLTSHTQALINEINTNIFDNINLLKNNIYEYEGNGKNIRRYEDEISQMFYNAKRELLYVLEAIEKIRKFNIETPTIRI